MPASETTISANLLEVSDLESSVVADRVRERYHAEFGESPEHPGGWYRPADWKRTSFVLERLRPGGKLLDVGTGAGQFANMLASTEQWDSVTALDHTRFGKYREYFDRMQRTDASIVKLPFDDDHFDVVTCMEVLEHVPDDVFLPGIAELRRVCRGQLIMSVPFQEQEPLSKGHLRRFEPADISELFPNGRLTVLTRPRMPWMIIEERLDGSVALPAERGAPMMFESDTTRYERRIAQLEAEVERLSSRKAIKIANTFGRALRTIDERVRSLRPGR
jgi:SAM-dependent methyltransferase